MRNTIIHYPRQYSDEPEIELDDEIIDKGETVYRERITKRGKQRTGLVPSHSEKRASGLAIFKPSFVTDQPNKNRTWLYDTPGIINDKQVCLELRYMKNIIY